MEKNKNTYLVIGPCYILTDEEYHNMCQEITDKNWNQDRMNILESVSGILIHSFGGDGLYDTNAGISVAVDSGSIIIINKDYINIDKYDEL